MTTRNMEPIKIRTTAGDREVDAYVFGKWAAHRPYGAPEEVPAHVAQQMASIGVFDPEVYWRVTYIPTGRCVPPSHLGPMSEQEAILLAQYFNHRIQETPIDPDPTQPKDITPGCILDALHAELLDEEGL